MLASPAGKAVKTSPSAENLTPHQEEKEGGSTRYKKRGETLGRQKKGQQFDRKGDQEKEPPYRRKEAFVLAQPRGGPAAFGKKKDA